MENVSSSNSHKELKPSLRFYEFDDSWKQCLFSDIAYYLKNRMRIVKTKFISTENMQQNCSGIVQYEDSTIVEGVAFSKDDILLANIRPYLKKIWKATFNGACSTDVLAMHINNALPEFIYCIMENDNFLTYIMSSAKGSKMPRGDKQHIMKYQIALPSLQEQQKISDFLGIIDKRIEKQTKLIDTLKSYKRGVTEHYFTAQKSNKKLEKTTISQCLFYEQPQKYIVHSEHYSDKYKTPVLTANKAFILGYTNEDDGIYDKGEVLIYDDFTMDIKFVDFPFKVKSSTIKILTPQNNIDLYFMFSLLQFLKLKPDGHQRSYISILEPMLVEIPNYYEQLRASKLFRLLDDRIRKEQQSLHKMMQLKSALMQQLFI